MPQNEPVFYSTSIMNRQNPNLVKAFSIIFGVKTTDLIVNHDRYSIMKPCKLNKDKIRHEWQSPYNVHMDLNPWKYIGRGLQSVP
eukprot:UN11819